jgi:ATP-dependent Clp protease, protease subunit
MNRKVASPKRARFSAEMQSDGTLELLCYGDIGQSDWNDDGITAKSVKQQLDSAGKYSRISLRINSPGGDAFEGVAIGNLLKSTGRPINVCVDGVAASAASIVAMAGSSILMAKNALMMIHNAWSVCVGNASDMIKMADTLGKVDTAIAQTYMDRTGMSLAAVQKLMDAETWMSAEDCVRDGFATGIAEEQDPDAMNMARSFKSMSRYKRLPAALKNQCACDCKACVGGDCTECDEPGCDDANCEDCPMQTDTANESDLSLYEAKLVLLGLGLKTR